MKQLVAPANRDALYKLLLKLDKNTTPLWGKMAPQQMVEHMIEQIRYTNGKLSLVFDVPEEQAKQAKHKWIYTDEQIPKGLVLAQLPAYYEYDDLAQATARLMQELSAFDRYFEPAGTLVNHGAYGPMDYTEWLIWHDKHLAHHLKQFGLLPQ